MAMAPRIDVSRIKQPVYARLEDDLLLSVRVLGMPQPDVTWYLGTSPLTGHSHKYKLGVSGTQHTLQLLGVTEDVARGVTVRAANTHGTDAAFIDCKIYKILRRRRPMRRAKSQTLPPQIGDKSETRKTIKVLKRGDSSSDRSRSFEVDRRRTASLGRINTAPQDIYYKYASNIDYGASADSQGFHKSNSHGILTSPDSGFSSPLDRKRSTDNVHQQIEPTYAPSLAMDVAPAYQMSSVKKPTTPTLRMKVSDNDHLLAKENDQPQKAHGSVRQVKRKKRSSRSPKQSSDINETGAISTAIVADSGVAPGAQINSSNLIVKQSKFGDTPSSTLPVNSAQADIGYNAIRPISSLPMHEVGTIPATSYERGRKHSQKYMSLPDPDSDIRVVENVSATKAAAPVIPIAHIKHSAAQKSSSNVYMQPMEMNTVGQHASEQTLPSSIGIPMETETDNLKKRKKKELRDPSSVQSAPPNSEIPPKSRKKSKSKSPHGDNLPASSPVNQSETSAFEAIKPKKRSKKEKSSQLDQQNIPQLVPGVPIEEPSNDLKVKKKKSRLFGKKQSSNEKDHIKSSTLSFGVEEGGAVPYPMARDVVDAGHIQTGPSLNRPDIVLSTQASIDPSQHIQEANVLDTSLDDPRLLSPAHEHVLEHTASRQAGPVHAGNTKSRSTEALASEKKRRREEKESAKLEKKERKEREKQEKRLRKEKEKKEKAEKKKKKAKVTDIVDSVHGASPKVNVVHGANSNEQLQYQQKPMVLQEIPAIPSTEAYRPQGIGFDHMHLSSIGAVSSHGASVGYIQTKDVNVIDINQASQDKTITASRSTHDIIVVGAQMSEKQDQSEEKMEIEKEYIETDDTQPDWASDFLLKGKNKPIGTSTPQYSWEREFLERTNPRGGHSEQSDQSWDSEFLNQQASGDMLWNINGVKMSSVCKDMLQDYDKDESDQKGYQEGEKIENIQQIDALSEIHQLVDQIEEFTGHHALSTLVKPEVEETMNGKPLIIRTESKGKGDSRVPDQSHERSSSEPPHEATRKHRRHKSEGALGVRRKHHYRQDSSENYERGRATLRTGSRSAQASPGRVRIKVEHIKTITTESVEELTTTICSRSSSPAVFASTLHQRPYMSVEVINSSEQVEPTTEEISKSIDNVFEGPWETSMNTGREVSKSANFVDDVRDVELSHCGMSMSMGKVNSGYIETDLDELLNDGMDENVVSVPLAKCEEEDGMFMTVKAEIVDSKTSHKPHTTVVSSTTVTSIERSDVTTEERGSTENIVDGDGLGEGEYPVVAENHLEEQINMHQDFIPIKGLDTEYIELEEDTNDSVPLSQTPPDVEQNIPEKDNTLTNQDDKLKAIDIVNGYVKMDEERDSVLNDDDNADEFLVDDQSDVKYHNETEIIETKVALSIDNETLRSLETVNNVQQITDSGEETLYQQNFTHVKSVETNTISSENQTGFEHQSEVPEDVTDATINNAVNVILDEKSIYQDRSSKETVNEIQTTLEEIRETLSQSAQNTTGTKDVQTMDFHGNNPTVNHEINTHDSFDAQTKMEEITELALKAVDYECQNASDTTVMNDNNINPPFMPVKEELSISDSSMVEYGEIETCTTISTEIGIETQIREKTTEQRINENEIKDSQVEMSSIDFHERNTVCQQMNREEELDIMSKTQFEYDIPEVNQTKPNSIEEHYAEQQIEETEVQIPTVKLQLEIIPKDQQRKKKAKSPPRSPELDIQQAHIFETSEMVHFRLRRYNKIDSTKSIESPRICANDLSFSAPIEQYDRSKRRVSLALKGIIEDSYGKQYSDVIEDEDALFPDPDQVLHFSEPQSTTIKFTTKTVVERERKLSGVEMYHNDVDVTNVASTAVKVTEKQEMVVLKHVDDGKVDLNGSDQETEKVAVRATENEALKVLTYTPIEGTDNLEDVHIYNPHYTDESEGSAGSSIDSDDSEYGKIGSYDISIPLEEQTIEEELDESEDDIDSSEQATDRDESAAVSGDSKLLIQNDIEIDVSQNQIINNQSILEIDKSRSSTQISVDGSVSHIKKDEDQMSDDENYQDKHELHDVMCEAQAVVESSLEGAVAHIIVDQAINEALVKQITYQNTSHSSNMYAHSDLEESVSRERENIKSFADMKSDKAMVLQEDVVTVSGNEEEDCYHGNQAEEQDEPLIEECQSSQIVSQVQAIVGSLKKQLQPGQSIDAKDVDLFVDQIIDEAINKMISEDVKYSLIEMLVDSSDDEDNDIKVEQNYGLEPLAEEEEEQSEMYVAESYTSELGEVGTVNTCETATSYAEELASKIVAKKIVDDVVHSSVLELNKELTHLKEILEVKPTDKPIKRVDSSQHTAETQRQHSSDYDENDEEICCLLGNGGDNNDQQQRCSTITDCSSEKFRTFERIKSFDDDQKGTEEVMDADQKDQVILGSKQGKPNKDDEVENHLEYLPRSYKNGTPSSLSESNYEIIMKDIKAEIQRLERILTEGHVDEGDSNELAQEILSLKDEYKAIAEFAAQSHPEVGGLEHDGVKATDVSIDEMLKLEDMLRFGGCSDEVVTEILEMVDEHVKTKDEQRTKDENVKDEELDQIMVDLANAIQPIPDSLHLMQPLNLEIPAEESVTFQEASPQSTCVDHGSFCDHTTPGHSAPTTPSSSLPNDSLLDAMYDQNFADSDSDSIGGILDSNIAYLKGDIVPGEKCSQIEVPVLNPTPYSVMDATEKPERKEGDKAESSSSEPGDATADTLYMEKALLESVFSNLGSLLVLALAVLIFHLLNIFFYDEFSV